MTFASQKLLQAFQPLEPMNCQCSRCLTKFVFLHGEGDNVITCPTCGLTKKGYIYEFTKKRRVLAEIPFRNLLFHVTQFEDHTQRLFNRSLQVFNENGELLNEIDLIKGKHCPLANALMLLNYELTDEEILELNVLFDKYNLAEPPTELNPENKETPPPSKKLKKVDKETQKKAVEKLKKSAVYVPEVTIEKDKDRVWFRIGEKRKYLTIDKTVELYNQFNQLPFEIEERFRKSFGVKINGKKTLKAIFKVLPEKPIVLITDTGNKLIRFVAESSNGHFAQKAGFFIKTEDNFIVSELTMFRGEEETTKTDKDEEPTVKTVIRPVLLYNRNGKRDFFDPRQEVLDFNGKSIYLEGKTELATTLHTLMSYWTAQRFLSGETVSVKEVYPKLILKFKKFVNCEWDKRIYDALACHAISTHFFDVFTVFGILYIYGPYETGKGRAGKCVVCASHRGLNVISPTQASFYRMIDALRPTLFFEEITKFWESFQIHWRASYKAGSRVPRIGKTKNEIMFLTLFEQFCPTIATSTRKITGAEKEATESRMIIITMRKAPDPNPKKIDPKETDFDEERNDLYMCRLTQAKEVSDIAEKLNKDSVIQQTFKGRGWEIWRPQLTIAKMISPQVFNNVLSFAKESIEERKGETYEKEKKMIAVIDSMIGIKDEVVFTPKKLSESMFEVFKAEFGYKDYGKEEITLKTEMEAKKKFNKIFNPDKLGRLLRRMDLKGKHGVHGTEYKITWEILSDMKTRTNYIELPSPDIELD